MKYSLLIALLTLNSVTARAAEQSQCTVYLSGGQSAEWVKTQAAEELTDFGCKIVDQSAAAKYSLSWGYAQASCAPLSRAQAIAAHTFANVFGSREAFAVLKDQSGSAIDSIQKSIWAPGKTESVCNIMNGAVNRGTAKMVNKLVAEIETLEQGEQ